MNHSANILLLISDPLDASISIQRDLLALQDALRELDCAATFHVRAAEAQKVQEHLSLGDSPRYDVLHYLGHGYKTPDKTDGVLIFEKDDGTADALDQIRLSVALKGVAAGFKLAVISACHSESVANALFTADIEHVIAIDGEKTVYEAAAVAFCRRFYQSLLTGRNLRESFTSGKEALFTDPTMRQLGNAATSAEVEKFKLLSRSGFDPAQFVLSVGSGQTNLEEWPALTAPPFDQHPSAGEFIGRNADMQELIQKLNRHRAAVIVGVSGIGKTELAKQTARRFAARRRVGKPTAVSEAVSFASLVNAKSAEDARIQIALALGLPPDGIADNGALQRSVPRHRLLILDEAENVIASDHQQFRQLLDALITAPGKPYVIVTSQTDPNTPKAPPVKLHRLSELAALRLFAANTALDGEDFGRINHEHLLEVLKQVDRLPRAIELIARVWQQERGSDSRNLDMTSLVEKLRADRDQVMADPDCPDEVKSVTVGVKYAYDRLMERSPAAARLWTQLALFPGGIAKTGVPQIFGAEAATLINQIEKQSLVESAFSHVSAPFGHLLELPTPFRFFALRHLGDEAAARQTIGESVLRYYYDFPEEAHRGWVAQLDRGVRQGGQAMGWFIGRFAAELSSIESWLDWAYDHETANANRIRAPRLTGLLQNLYVVTNTLYKKRDRLNRALACALRCGDREGEANVLKAMGDLLMRVDDLAGARGSYEKALPIYREIEDRLGEANVLQMLGNLALAEGEANIAFDNFRTALQVHSEIENYLGVAGCYGYLGRAAKVGGDHPRAVLLLEEAITIYRQITAAWSEGIVLGWQGESFFQLELGDAAMAAMWQARDLMRISGNPQAQQFDVLFRQVAQSEDEAKTLLDALPTQAEAIRQQAIAALKKAVESETEEGTSE